MKKLSKLFILSTLCLASCSLQEKTTTIEIVDAARHYYPVLRGETLDVVYKIKNTGKNPLFISDIQTSCGCMLVDESSYKVLPANKEGFVRVQYNSNKNIGYVKHYITIYGNLETQKQEAIFDVNVVPNALYTRDYEELYKENKKKNEYEKILVDGNQNNLGYYVDNLPANE